MRDNQNNEFSTPDDFRDKLVNSKDIYKVSPKMSEYIETIETFLIIREKKLVEKINPNAITLGKSGRFRAD